MSSTTRPRTESNVQWSVYDDLWELMVALSKLQPNEIAALEISVSPLFDPGIVLYETSRFNLDVDVPPDLRKNFGVGTVTMPTRAYVLPLTALHKPADNTAQDTALRELRRLYNEMTTVSKAKTGRRLLNAIQTALRLDLPEQLEVARSNVNAHAGRAMEQTAKDGSMEGCSAELRTALMWMEEWHRLNHAMTLRVASELGTTG